jgi:hypothetical protein
MKKIFFLFLLSLSYLLSFSQTNNDTACNKLKSKGYTQQFCDYNIRYSYKNIPFESSYSSISSKLNLTKEEYSANKYNCKDINVLEWASVKFDNCIFDFSSDDKLDGIQLQLHSNFSPTINDEIRYKINQVKIYLTTFFRKPEKFPGSELNMWKGNKVYILISGTSDQELSAGAVIGIFRTNLNPINGL